METALVTGLLIVAATFVIAGGAKLADLSGFRGSLQEFGLSAYQIRFLVWLIPVSELASAGMLLVPSASWFGALLALTLLLALSCGVAYNLIQGRTPTCNCFGQLGASRIGSRTIIRNLLLVLIAAILVVEIPSEIFERSSRLVIVTSLTTVSFLITLAALVRKLSSRQDDLSAQIEKLQDFLESGAFTAVQGDDLDATPEELPIGVPTPEFSLLTLDDQEIEFDGPGDLVEALAASAEARSCYAGGWLSYAYGRNLASDDAPVLAEVGVAGRSVREIMAAVALTKAFRKRAPNEVEP